MKFTDKEILGRISFDLSAQIAELERLQKLVSEELQPNLFSGLSSVEDRLQEIVIDVNNLWEKE